MGSSRLCVVWDCDDSLHCERERRVVLPEATNVVVGVVAAAEKLIHRGFRSESVRRRLLGANRERE